MKTFTTILLLCSLTVAQTPDFNFCAQPWRAASAAVPQIAANDFGAVKESIERQENAILLVAVGLDESLQRQVEDQARSNGWYYCTAVLGGGATQAWPQGWERGVHKCQVIGGVLRIIGGDSYEAVMGRPMQTTVYDPVLPGQPPSQPRTLYGSRTTTYAGQVNSRPAFNAAPYGMNPIGTINADGSRTVGYGQTFYVRQASSTRSFSHNHMGSWSEFNGNPGFGFNATNCVGGS